MKSEDLGIDPGTKIHNQTLTRTENKFLALLWTDHVGEDNKISADELAVRFRDALLDERSWPPEFFSAHLQAYRRWRSIELNQPKRDARHMHNHLLTRHDTIPILSKAGNGGGYWIAENEAEAAEFYNTFRQRGLTGLVKASRGKKAVLVEMMQQLSFEFDELVDQSGYAPGTGRRSPGGQPAPIAVVDAFIEKMMRNPEKFSEGLRKIGRKYGSVLLPKEQVKAMQAKARELQELVGSLEV